MNSMIVKQLIDYERTWSHQKTQQTPQKGHRCNYWCTCLHLRRCEAEWVRLYRAALVPHPAGSSLGLGWLFVWLFRSAPVVKTRGFGSAPPGGSAQRERWTSLMKCLNTPEKSWSCITDTCSSASSCSSILRRISVACFCTSGSWQQRRDTSEWWRTSLINKKTLFYISQIHCFPSCILTYLHC